MPFTMKWKANTALTYSLLRCKIMMHFITKAMSINNIDGKATSINNIDGESLELSLFIKSQKVHITLLVIHVLRGSHTHTHTHTHMHAHTHNTQFNLFNCRIPPVPCKEQYSSALNECTYSSCVCVFSWQQYDNFKFSYFLLLIVGTPSLPRYVCTIWTL